MKTNKSPLFRHFRRRPGVFAGENSPVPHSVPCFSPFRNRQGVALVIVLAFVVLLTGVVVAYFARSMADRQLSNSSFNQAKADEMARSALDIITGDLKQEIANGSTATTAGNVTIYTATNNASMVPQRNGVPATWNGPLKAVIPQNTTLIRVSGTNSITSPGVDHAASNAITTGTSANGRTISMARWNRHYLIPLNSTTQTDTTPDTAFVAPSWVYVSGTGGPTVLTAPANSVVGRYAYAVYDEGALLDVNVAGFPCDTGTYTNYPAAKATSGTIPAPYAPKGSTAFADLTVLPVQNMGTTELTQTGINNLVAWRNYASLQNGGTIPGGAFPTLTLSGPSMLTTYKNLIASNTNGFTQVSGSATGSGMTDQAFLTRQQLINLVQATGKTNFNPLNLAFLGTFSRTVAAPSWKPTATIGTPSGNTIDYAGQAETSGKANRNLANVRCTTATSPATVTHYSDGVINYGPTGVVTVDASGGIMKTAPVAATYLMAAGDQLMQSRFSLAKIAWLSQANPNGGGATLNGTGGTGSDSATYAAAIQSCFGLKWGVVGTANGGNACWSYVGATGSTPVGAIETLDQVAAEAREPNFFELLKASILSGSLGVNPGTAADANGTLPQTIYSNGQYGKPQQGCDNLYSYSFDRVAYTPPALPARPAPALINDVQIMQIGANIIDQYDADSYPTAIYFKYNGITSANDAAVAGNEIFGPTDMVYGDENLPYLLGMMNIDATVDGMPSVPGYGITAGLSQWWQPEIWNPHQMPNPANSSVSPPKTFMVKGYGLLKVYWSDTGWRAATSPPGSVASDTTLPQPLDTTAGATTPQTISFTDSNPTTSTFYAQPWLLTVDTVPGVTASTSIPQMTANSSMAHYNAPDPYGTTNPPRNHFVGFWAGNSTKYMGGTGDINVQAEQAGAATFCLGWTDSSGGFHPYSYEPGLCISIYGVIHNDSTTTPIRTSAAGVWPVDSTATNHMLVDPRTMRFASTTNWELLNAYTYFPDSNHAAGYNQDTNGCGQPSAPWFTYKVFNQYGYSICDWEVNSPTPLTQTAALANYYKDPDGVVRPGDGVFGNYLTGDGMLLYCTGDGSPRAPKGAGTGGTASGDTISPTSASSGSNTTGNTYHGRRPVILNRPFRSVGELGYTFRDLPLKSLDFFSKFSADAALLDVFSVNDQSRVSNGRLNSVAAGQVNLSNAPFLVIQAILAGASKKDFDPAYNVASNSKNLPQAITAALNPINGSIGPLTSRADLVTRLGADPATGVGAIRNGLSSSPPDQNNKAYLESPVRALADVTNTRTWNLMIDVIAQTGTFPPNAPNTAAALNTSFNVQGERRYWLHIAIDRFTGKVIDQQFEPVYE